MSDAHQAHDSKYTDFWSADPSLDSIAIEIKPPEKSLEILEKLGSSPFERGGFPLIGFLATTYEKVTRIALAGCAKDLDGGSASETQSSQADST
ncbi:MAG: hypothetical protein HY287_05285 [Planctomycetes bacterium]|nr:hypothetical protein [Planctomycetota bacterium]MBI3833724.1 hypothetical protein [Planctomycetota bacterium]